LGFRLQIEEYRIQSDQDLIEQGGYVLEWVIQYI